MNSLLARGLDGGPRPGIAGGAGEARVDGRDQEGLDVRPHEGVLFLHLVSDANWVPRDKGNINLSCRLLLLVNKRDPPADKSRLVHVVQTYLCAADKVVASHVLVPASDLEILVVRDGHRELLVAPLGGLPSSVVSLAPHVEGAVLLHQRLALELQVGVGLPGPVRVLEVFPRLADDIDLGTGLKLDDGNELASGLALALERERAHDGRDRTVPELLLSLLGLGALGDLLDAISGLRTHRDGSVLQYVHLTASNKVVGHGVVVIELDLHRL
mmetsp:Transcript_6393/g.13271  ORF Transcript_6393/g.13271 Transcript_6393/m.13271 type:complete len:271 (-) Transcript_6393:4585-5397(-)